MKIEVSCLFKTDYHPKEVTHTHIGDGISIEKVADGEWLRSVLGKNYRLEAKQEVDGGPFTHRANN